MPNRDEILLAGNHHDWRSHFGNPDGSDCLEILRRDPWWSAKRISALLEFKHSKKLSLGRRSKIFITRLSVEGGIFTRQIGRCRASSRRTKPIGLRNQSEYRKPAIALTHDSIGIGNTLATTASMAAGHHCAEAEVSDSPREPLAEAYSAGGRRNREMQTTADVRNNCCKSKSQRRKARGSDASILDR